MESFNSPTTEETRIESVDLLALMGEMDRNTEFAQAIPASIPLPSRLPLLNCDSPVIASDPSLLSEIMMNPTERETFDVEWNLLLRQKLLRSTHESVVNECMVLHHAFKEHLPDGLNVKGEVVLHI
jgi:hypothetical protein